MALPILEKIGSIDRPQEVSLTDKLLARRVEREIERLVKKERRLDLKDTRQLLHLIASEELKLANFDDDYRAYILSKLYVWVREYAAIYEELFMLKKKIDERAAEKKSEKLVRASKIIDDTITLVSGDITFLVSVYLHLLRATLGINAHAFDGLSKTRYEYEYNTRGEASETLGILGHFPRPEK